MMQVGTVPWANFRGWSTDHLLWRRGTVAQRNDVTIEISPESNARLVELSNQLGISPSAVLDLAVRDYARGIRGSDRTPLVAMSRLRSGAIELPKLTEGETK
jgi:hypothetical protein